MLQYSTQLQLPCILTRLGYVNLLVLVARKTPMSRPSRPVQPSRPTVNTSPRHRNIAQQAAGGEGLGSSTHVANASRRLKSAIRIQRLWRGYSARVRVPIPKRYLLVMYLARFWKSLESDREEVDEPPKSIELVITGQSVLIVHRQVLLKYPRNEVVIWRPPHSSQLFVDVTRARAQKVRVQEEEELADCVRCFAKVVSHWRYYNSNFPALYPRRVGGRGRGTVRRTAQGAAVSAA